MKKILFVIDSLSYGGAEKSLVSLLSNIDYSVLNVDILMFNKGGEFEKYLPKEVNILSQPKYFKYLNNYRYIKFKYLRARVTSKIDIFKNKHNMRVQPVQILYKNIKSIIEPLEKEYDVAIAYSQGLPTYYVVEKVESKKKIAWINCDYKTTIYNKDMDYEYYKKIDEIVTVSNFAYEGIKSMKYNYEDKLNLIYDIVDPKLITSMAVEFIPKEFIDKEFNILTVGRLEPVKGYDMVIDSSWLLKKSGVKFKWFLIGEGSMRKKLEEKIKEKDLSQNVILLGGKSNPYPYMKNCDLYVQTSLKEGFGLTVIEAKILKKIVLCTEFTTAKELINDREDGFIVKRDPKILAAKIKCLSESHDDALIEKINHKKSYSTVKEVEKIYKLILGGN